MSGNTSASLNASRQGLKEENPFIRKPQNWLQHMFLHFDLSHPTPTQSIKTSDNGFTVHFHRSRNRSPLTLLWSEIQQVMTFKRDQMIVDLICLQFTTTRDTFIEVDEDMKGFADLLATLPDKLSGFPEGSVWWGEVMQPAFATNEKTLWKAHNTPR